MSMSFWSRKVRGVPKAPSHSSRNSGVLRLDRKSSAMAVSVGMQNPYIRTYALESDRKSSLETARRPPICSLCLEADSIQLNEGCTDSIASAMLGRKIPRLDAISTQLPYEVATTA